MFLWLVLILSFRPVYEHGRGEWVEDLVIGDADGEGVAFLLPGAVRADSHGNVFVLESRDKVLQKFDAEGNHLITFSRPGEGPGEMGMVWVMAIDARDRVLIWDHSYKRFTMFDTSGELLDTVPYQPTVQAMECASNGFVFVETHGGDFSQQMAQTVVRLVRLSAELGDPVVVDSLRIVDHAIIQATKESSTSVTLPFVEGLAWAVMPDGGVVVGRTGDDRLTWYDAELRPVREVELRAQPIATGEADKERYLRGFGSDDERFLDVVRKQVPFPDHTPYFADVYVDHDGFVLVSRYDDVDDGVLYEVLSPQGEPLGDVVMPSLDRADLRHGYVYRARRKGDAFPQVCRFRLEPKR